MAISLNDNIEVRGPKLVDSRSGVFENGFMRPYKDKNEVDVKLNINLRTPLLSVFIQTETDDRPIEYWFIGGIGVNHLEPKLPGGSEMGGGFEFLETDEDDVLRL